MMPPFLWSIPAVIALCSSANGQPLANAALETAIDRGFRRLEKGAANYTTHRQCFSCHHQAMPVWALSSARQRGLKAEPEIIRQQIEFTLDYFRPKKEEIAKGQWMPGGNTMAVFALLTFEACGRQPDELTDAIIDYLLKRQAADGSWPALANRPPSEGSRFTNCALAIRALKHFTLKRSDAARSRANESIVKGETWLRKNKPVTTEDKAFFLRALVYLGAEGKEIKTVADQLAREQHQDGGWAQLADLNSDAYAAGNVLTALRTAGMDVANPVYQKGIRFLLSNQKPDGSWIVESRSRQVQTFFDNGDPGGKSQFISMTATAWAALALMEAAPQRSPSAR